MSLAMPDTNTLQRAAADSTRSVWVAASAGTGKTKVLTDRVLNLLLSGAVPARILCLTFTKAAAAEMSIRLNARLSGWATAGDERLGADIESITGSRPKPERLVLARQLFARVLDTPGGMRILTIHAFCQSVLRRFPLEAGIPPQFEVMDERTAAELFAEAQAVVIDAARLDPGGMLAAAFAAVTTRAQEQRFGELLYAVGQERDRFRTMIDSDGGIDGYLRRLRTCLGLPSRTQRDDGDDEERCLAELCRSSSFDEAGLRRSARVLATAGTKTDQDRAPIMADWLAADDSSRAALYAGYRACFLTTTLEPRKVLATNGSLAADGSIGPILAAEQERLLLGQQRLAAAAVYTATAALSRLATTFLEAYAAQKRRRTALDYDDLILITRALLHRPGVAPWVLFKLDGGIDHILIDEAQDTNPDQWQVVAALSEEFFSGDGARAATRTIFAVGDTKQSIFSFQRADPAQFGAMRKHFADRISIVSKDPLRDVPLQTSFRSSAAVLQVVDSVFADPAVRAGVTFDDTPIRHALHRVGQAGRVELWPPMLPTEPDPPVPWAPPVRQTTTDAPRARLARLIARTIAHWLEKPELLASQGRPVRAGDILVLVRRRTGFVPELLRELKRLHVPVAGTDRIVLTRQAAIMDLMALGRFLLLPDDDLTLAALLKSPLVGLDETQLYELAQGRPGRLWSALRDHPAPWAKEAAASLSALMARADFVPPHELYAELLSKKRGREKLLSRLGREAADAIDEFLAQALAYEQTHAPSLQGFLAWLDASDAELKRDTDQAGRDEVRIMTVHGAKGLQAPIVFVPDTMAVPAKLPPLLWPETERCMMWAPSTASAEPIASRARDEAKRKRSEEYRRLLYVALTRAEDRLYVCGWRASRTTSEPSWYDYVQAGMQRLPNQTLVPIEVPPGCEPHDSPGFVWDVRQAVPATAKTVAAAFERPASLPGYATRPAPNEPAPPRPLVASRPALQDPPVRSPLSVETDRDRFQRGLLIHRLLQTLPDLPPDAVEAATRRFLALPAHALEPALQAEIAAECIAVVRHAEFAPLFGPSSRAEVPLVGLVNGRVLSARVDRLVVTTDTVLVVDYKTNRPPPVSVGAVSAAYVDQLGAYRKALELIYPGRRIRTLLLWTDGPRIMEIGAVG